MNDKRWLAIREAIGVDRLKNLCILDLGCLSGDLVAAATADGVYAVGIDRNAFAIDEAQKQWGHLGNVNFMVANIATIPEVMHRGFDVILLLSTWAYIVYDYSQSEAWSLLKDIKKHCKLLFFESQLDGDGLGPTFFQTKEDVVRLLSFLGYVEEIISIPVDGKDRTIFMVS